MKFSEITVMHQALLGVVNMTLPRKVSVAVSRNLSKIEKEITLYNSQREDIAGRYARKDEQGNYILDGNNYTFVSDENKEAFLQEAKELNETDIDIDFMKFRAEELDRCDEVERYSIITPAQEMALEWMIDYGDED